MAQTLSCPLPRPKPGASSTVGSGSHKCRKVKDEIGSGSAGGLTEGSRGPTQRSASSSRA